MGFKIDPKSVPKSFKNKIVPTYPQKTASRGPKTFPEAPRPPQQAAKTPQDVPRRFQEGPKAPLDARPPCDPRNAPRWPAEIHFFSDTICLIKENKPTND